MDISEKLRMPYLFLFKAFHLLKSMDRYLLLLLTIPVFIVFLEDGWIFFRVFRLYIDPWTYVGYFLNLKQHLNTFTHAYYGARLPWIMLGSLIYSLFSPLVATYILSLVVCYSSIVSLYLILKRIAGRNTAFIVSLLLSGYSWFLPAVGSAYIEGVGIAFLLLSLCFLTPNIGSRYYSISLIFAGIFIACTIYTQFFLLNYIPLLFFYFIWITRSRSLFSFWRDFCFCCLGFLLVSLFFCISSFFLDGNFCFFLDSMHACKWILAYDVNPWWVSLSGYWKGASWLILPAVLLVISLAICIAYKVAFRQKISRYALFFSIYVFGNIVIHIIWQFALQQPVLQLDYYSCYMIPGMFLFLGVLFSPVIEQLQRKEFLLLSILVLCVTLFPYILEVNMISSEEMLKYILILGLVSFCSIFLRYPGYQYTAILSLALFFSCINWCSYPFWTSKQYSRDPSRDAYISVIESMRLEQAKVSVSTFNQYSRDQSRDAYISVIESMKLVQTMSPNANAYFWYDAKSPLGSVFVAIASTYLWGYRLINEHFPSLPSPSLAVSRGIFVGDHIILLGENASMYDLANEKLSQIGLQGKFLKQKLIQKESIQYYLTLIEIECLNFDM